jgi:hypothetical protein
MQTAQSVSSADALKVNRAFGALLFSFFGVVLLEVWDRRAGAGVAVFGTIALLGLPGRRPDAVDERALGLAQPCRMKDHTAR